MMRPFPLQERPPEMTKIPETQDEAATLLFQTGLVVAYEAIAAAAWRGRLTNADIARIERETLVKLKEANEAAEEFSTFELEKVVAKVRASLQTIFDGARARREQPR